MRSLPQVVTYIKRTVPEDYEGRIRLLRDINDLLNSNPYMTPEGNYWRWEQLENVIHLHLGAPDAEWKVKIQTYLRGE